MAKWTHEHSPDHKDGSLAIANISILLASKLIFRYLSHLGLGRAQETWILIRGSDGISVNFSVFFLTEHCEEMTHLLLFVEWSAVSSLLPIQSLFKERLEKHVPRAQTLLQVEDNFLANWIVAEHIRHLLSHFFLLLDFCFNIVESQRRLEADYSKPRVPWTTAHRIRDKIS